ncbi:neuroblast differentiation-associated protein AHNAK-like [Heptranchias perlo]|uniref:neuroblast differentiation-associated protein AHNAK-like n=1 Tax=Heptranchias perlo TaxID=212740 RepID=UPI003559A17A
MSHKVEEKEKDVVEVIVNTEAEVGASGFSVKSGEKEGIFIKHVLKESPAAKRLSMREGDQLISATIYFDNVRYEDALKILQYSEPYKMQYCLKRTIPSGTGSEAVEMKGIKPIAGAEEDFFMKLYRNKTKTRDASDEINTQTETQMKETTQKGRSKLAEVPDVTFTCPKFPAFKKTKTYKLDRSHSLSETEERDQHDITATSTDIESHLKTAETPQKVKKRRRKIKLPHIGARGIKIGKTEASEDEKQELSTGTMDSSTLKYDTISADSTPQKTNDTTITTIKQSEPKLENQSHEMAGDNTNIESKFKMPKLKIAKFVLSEPILPTFDTATKLPEDGTYFQTSDANVEHQKIEIECSNTHSDTIPAIQITDSEKKLKTSGGMSKLKSQMGSEHVKTTTSQQGVSQKEVSITDVKSDVTLLLHEDHEASINKQITDISLPKCETRNKKPKTDMQGKIKKPKMKEPKDKTAGTYPKSSKLAIDVSLMKVDVSLPSTDVDVKGSAVEIKPGKLEDVLSVGAIELEGPDASLKMPKIKKPSTDIPTPTVKGKTDVDTALSKPEFDVPAPALSGDIKGPATDINVPTLDVDVGLADLKVKGDGGKFKMPTKKMPSFGVSFPKFKGPEVDVSMKQHDVDISLAKPDVDIKGTEIDVGVPECEVNVEIPDVDIEGGGGNIKLAKFKGPKSGFSAPDIKSPKMKFDASLPKVDTSPPKTDVDVKMPAADINPGKLEGDLSVGDIELEGPDASLKMPKIKKPSIDIPIPTVKGKIDVDTALSKPEFGVATPGLSVDIKGPATDIHVPTMDVDVGSADLKVRSDGSMFKMPTMKMPSFGVSFPKCKGPQVDVTMKEPDVDISLAKLDMDIKGPNIDVAQTEGEVDVEIPDVDVDGGGGKIKMPKFKGPKFGFSAPDIKAHKMKLDASLPKADISIPKADVDVKVPAVDIKPGKLEGDLSVGVIEVEGPDAQLKMPKIKKPSIDIPIPTVKGKVDVDTALSKPEFDVAAPGLSVDIKGPATDIHVPTIDVDVHSADLKVKGDGGKFKMPTMKIPKFGVSFPKFKGPEVDVSMKKPDVDISQAKPDVDIKGPKIDVGAPECEVDVQIPDVDIEGGGGKIKLPKSKGPKFGFSASDRKPPKMKLDTSLPKVDITLPKADVDVKVPAVDIKPGKLEGELNDGTVELEGPDASLKMPKIKMPSIDLPNPKVKGKIDVDTALSKPEFDVAAPGLSVDIKGPTTEIHIPTIDVDVGSADLKEKGDGGKFKIPTMKMPSFGVSLPKFKGPEVDVSVKKPDMDISLPEPDIDIKGPKIDVGAPDCEVDVEIPDVDICGGGGKIKMPKFKGPKFGFSAADIKTPKMKLNASIPKADISLPKADVDVKEQAVDIKPGKLEGDLSVGANELEGPDASLKMPKIKKPSVDIPIPTMKGKIDVDTALSKPEFDVAAPGLSVDIKGPATDIHVPTIDVDVQSADLKVKGDGGKFKMPTMKMPSFGASLPKFKGPEVDLSMKKPDMDISLPEPDIYIEGPKIDVGAPECEVNVEIPDVDIGGVGGKSKLPKFKGPKFGFSAPDIKPPKMKLDASLPKANISLPKADVDVKVPAVDIKPGKLEGELSVGAVEVEGPDASLKMPKIKMPSIDLPIPMVKGKIDVDTALSKPEFDVAAPGLSVDIKGPATDINFPTIDADVGSADLKVKGDGGKFKMPTMKMPSFGVSLPKFKGPEVDLSMKKPDMDISLPEPDIDIKGPKIDVGAPECEVDVEIPDVDIGGGGGKIKMPKFKGPKFGFSAPDIKPPKMKLDASLPKADISLPKADVDVKVPAVDIKPGKLEGELSVGAVEVEGPDASLKMPKIKMPSIDLPIPMVKGKIDVDTALSKPEFDVAAPGLSVDIKGPATDIHVPTIDVDVQSADLKVKCDGGKFKMPTMKMPSFGVSLPKFKGPEVDLSMKKPDMDISLPEPDIYIKGPKIDVGAPECEVNVEIPDVDIGGVGGKSKLPKFKGPKFGFPAPDIKPPKMKLDASLPKANISLPKADVDVKVPAVDIKPGKLEGELSVGAVEVEGPDASLKMPKIKMPSIDLPIPMVKGKIDVDAALSKPEFDVAAPGLSVDIKGPATDINFPTIDADVGSADLKVKGDGGKFKMPTMKMPSFGVSFPKFKGPEVDLSMKKPDMDISLPEPDIDIKGPKIDVGAPECEVDVEIPDVDIGGGGGKIKMPKFKGPKFGFSAPDIKPPKMKLDASLPKADISLPKADVDVKVPAVDIKPGKLEGELSVGAVEVEGPDASLKMPKIKMPSIDLPIPMVKGKIDVDTVLSKPEFDVAAPGLSVDIKGPATDINFPTIDADVGSADLNVKGDGGKFKMPTMKMPSFGVSLPKLKGPEVDVSMKEPDVDISLAKPEADMKGPKIDIRAPECEVDVEIPAVDIDGGGGKIKMPNFKGPKFGFSTPDIKAPQINLDASLPKVDISVPKVNVDVKVPAVDIKPGKLEGDLSVGANELEVPDASLKMPKIKKPSVDIPIPTMKEKIDVDTALSKPEFDVAAPGLSVDIKGPPTDIHVPTIDVDVHSVDLKVKGDGGKFKMPTMKMPSFGVSLPKFKGPEVDLSMKKPDMDISLPEPDIDIKGPKIDVGAPECEVDVEIPDVDIGGGGGKIKMPKFKGPKFGFSAPDIKPPKMKLDASLPKADISLPKADVDVKVPAVDIKPGKLEGELSVGAVEVEGPDASLKMPKIKMPSIDLPIPMVKGKIDVDTALSKPEFDVAAPGLSVDIKGPATDIHIPTIDVEVHSADLKVKGDGGKFKMPTMKMPSFGVSLPKFKGPEVDLSMKKPDMDISLPEPDIDIKGPKIEVGAPECEVDVEIPDVDIDGGGGKIKLPKFKGPKFGFSAPDIKPPKMKLDASLPKANISLPKADVDVKVPAVDIKPGKLEGELSVGAVEVDGPDASLKMPKLKMPSIDLPIPMVKGKIDVDTVLSKPEFDVAAPGVDIKGPATDINVPTIDVDVGSADLKVKGDGGKFKMPTMKMPSFGVSLPKLKRPEVDVSMKEPDVDISLAKPEADMKGPKIDIRAPECEVDVEIPAVDIDGRGGKIKMPKFKGPKFGISTPDIKVPQINLDASLTKVDISVPKADVDVKVPAVDIKPGKLEGELSVGAVEVEGADASLKMPKIKMPSIDLPIPKVKGKIDVDTALSKPEFDVAAPGLSVDIKGPATNIHIPTIEADVHSADLKVKRDGGKFKMPTMKLPSFGVSFPKFKGPEVDISMKKPDVDISLAKPDVDIKGPKIDVGTPECEVDVEIPDVDIDGGGGKIKMPKVKGPKFGFSAADIKTPKMKLDASLPKVDISLPKVNVDVKVPAVDIKPGKLEGDLSVGANELEGPDASLKMPKIKKPSVDIPIPTMKGKIDVDTALSKPEFDVSAPGLSVDIKGPATDIHVPTIDVDVHSADLKVKGDGGKFKMPTMKMPSFGVSLPKFKGPEVDLSMKKPDMDISLPEPDIDIKGPKIEVGAPECEVDVEIPDVDIDGGGGKIKMPKFKGPKFGFSAPDIKPPKMKLDASLPKANISLPKADVDVKVPAVDIKPGKLEGELSVGAVEVEGPDASLKMPKIKMPSIDLPIPMVKGKIDVDTALSKPEFDVAAPGLSVDIKGPATDINFPTIDADVGSADLKVKGAGGKFKMPTMKMPSFGVSLPKFKGPEVDLSMKKPDMDISLPEPDIDIKGPKIDVGAPECEVDVEIPDVDIGGGGGKIKMPKFKGPKFGFSAPDIKPPKMKLDASLPKADISLPKADVDVKVPAVDIKPGKLEGELSVGAVEVEGPDASLKMPKIKMPSIDLPIPMVKGKIDVDTALSKPEFDVAAPGLSVDIKGPATDINVPTIDVDVGSADLKVKGDGGKFKMPTMKMPSFGVSLPKLKRPEVDVSMKEPDVDISLAKPEADMKGPKIDIRAPECEVDVEIPAVDIDGRGGKIKMPKFKGPKFGISTPDIKAPQINLDASLTKVDISVPKADVDVKVPAVDIKPGKLEGELSVGAVEVEGADASLKMPKIKMPSIDLPIPMVKGKIDVDTALSKPEFDVAAPGLSVDIKGPATNIHIPTIEADFHSADLKVKRDGGKFKMPTIKLPSFGVSFPKFKGPEVDISMKKPDVDISLAKPDVDIKGPNIDVGTPECEVDVEIPDVDIDGGGGKIKMPKVKGPKFGFSAPDIKTPKMKLDASLPKVDISLPKVNVDVKVPAVDIKPGKLEGDLSVGANELEGPDASLKMSKIKKPSVDIPIPTMKGKIDVDTALSKPEFDVAAPGLSVDIKGPATDIHVPTIDVDVHSADLKVKGDGGKFKMPTMKMPSFGVSLPKFKGPEVDLSMKKPDISLPEPDIDIKGPKIEVGAPECEVDVEIPDVDIGGGGGKIKMPKFKGPKFGFSAPDIKPPKMKLDASLPKANISLPKADVDVKVPAVDIKPGKLEGELIVGAVELEGTDASLKMPKIKMPSIDLPIPMVKGKIDVDTALSEPEFDVAAPGLSVDIKGPATDINVPTTDVDVGSAGLKVKGAGGKFKMPTMKMPSFGVSLPKLKGPEVDVSMKEPDVDISLAKPEVDIKGTKIDVQAPECEVNVEIPAVDIDGVGGKIKMPNFKGPKFGFSTPDIKVPQINLDASLPKVDISLPKSDVDVKVPAVDIKPGKLEGELSVGAIELEGPDASLQMPKIKKPSIDIPIPMVKGKIDVDTAFSAPEFDVSAPGLSVDIKGPATDIHIPTMEADVHSADLKVKRDGGKFKMPTMKMPSFGVSLPKFKGPEVDLSMKKPDVDISLAKPDVDIKGPKIDVGAPECEVDVEIPDVDIDGGGGKIKMPKVKGPKFGFSAPDIKTPKMKLDANLPKVDISLPKVNVDVKVPAVDIKPGKLEGDLSVGAIEVEGPDASLKLPKVKKPSIDIPIPTLNGKTDVGTALSKPEFDVAAPGLSVDMKRPATDIHVPTIDVDVGSAYPKVKGAGSKFKMPTMKMPSFGVSLPKFKGPELDVSMKKPDVDISLAKPNVDIKDPKIDVGAPECRVDVEIPDVDIDGSGGKIKMPKFKGPKFGFSAPDMKVPQIQLDASLPKDDISLPKPDVDVKLPAVDIKSGKLEGDLSVGVIELEGPDASLKMPKIKKPSIDISIPMVKGKIDVDTALSKPEFDVSAPGLSVDMKRPLTDTHVPTIDVDVGSADLKVKGAGSKFKMPTMKLPSFGVSLPKFKGPEVDISMKKPDVDISLAKPDMDIKGPKIDVAAPECEVDVEIPDVDVDGEGGKIKMPKFKGTKFGFSAPDIKAPKINLDASLPKVDISLPKADVDVKVPAVDIKPGKLEGELSVGTFELEGPDAHLKMPKLKKPSIDVPIPMVKGEIDVETALPKSEFDVAAPGLSVDIKGPATDIHVPTIDVDVGSADLKVKGAGGKFKMPTMKIPSFGVSLPKFKGPEVDVSMKKPDVGISLAKPDVDIKGRKIDIAAPECEVDVEMPDVDVDGEGGKIKMPTFKGPKFGFSAPDIKAPKMKLDASLPKVDISPPKADVDVEVPAAGIKPGKLEGDLSVGTIELEGPDANLKMPTIKKPSVDILVSTVKGKIDVATALSEPEFDVAAPGLSVDIKTPATDIHAPTIDVDVGSADLKVKGDGGKFKMPTMKLPSFGVSLPKFKGPEVDISMKKPDVDISLPEPDIDIKGPKIDVAAPECEVDVEIPDVDVDGEGGKIKMPKFKGTKFGFSAPDIKAPKINLDASLPKVDISLPKADVDVKVPAVDIKPGKLEGELSVGTIELEGPDAHLNLPKLKKPSIDVPIPMVKGEIDVDTALPKSEFDVAAPGLSVDIKGPATDIHVPTIDVDVGSADLKVKGAGGKFKMPTMKIPSFGVSLPKFKGPEVDVSMKKPDVDISLAKPDVDIKGRKIDVAAPECEVDVEMPDVDIDGGGGKIKIPKFKALKFGFSAPDIKSPKMKLDASLPKVDISLPKADVDVKVRGVDIEPGKLEGDLSVGSIELEGPDASLTMPKIKKPSLDIPIPMVKGKIDADTALSKPEFDVAAPGLSVDIKVPATDINVPTTDVDVGSADLKVKVDGGKFKIPTMKMPSFGISLPKFKGPEVDISMKKPDVEILLPKPDVVIKGPKIDVGAPECDVDIEIPDVDIDGGGGKIKMSQFKGPKFSAPDINAPEMELVASLPKVDISLPKADVNVKVPAVDVKPGKLESELRVGAVVLEGPDASLKMPKIKKPSIDIPIPTVKGKIDVDPALSKSEFDVAAPGLSVDIKSPVTDIHVRTIDADVGSADLKVKGDGSKFKMPTMKLPSFGISLPKFKGSEVDVSMQKPDAAISLAKPDVDIKGPKVDLGAPECEVDVKIPDADIDGGEGKIKLSKFQVPKFGFSARDIKAPKMNLDASLSKVDISLPKADVDVKVPAVDIKPGKLEGELSVAATELEGPDASLKMPTIKKPSVSIPIPMVEGKIDVDTALSRPEFDVGAPALSVGIKAPATDIHDPTIDVDVGSADLKVKGAGGKFKMPTMKMPSFGFSLPKFKGSEVDVSMKKPDVDTALAKPDVDVKGPKIDEGTPKCEVDIEKPDVGIGGGGGKIKIPKFKGPKFGFSAPDIKAPKMNIDASLPKVDISLPKADVDVKVPAVDIKPGKLEGDLSVGPIEVEGPDASPKMSKIKMPSIDIPIPAVKRKIDVDTALSKPEFDVAAPRLSVDVKGPVTDIHVPTIDVDVGSADLKVKGDGGKFKMPTMKMPSFGVSLPKFKGPEVDVSMKKPDVDILLAKPEVDIKGPKIDVGVPECEVDVQIPDVDIEGGEGKIKMPKFKGPKFGFSAPDIKAPKVNLDASLPKVDISLPKADVDVKVPAVDIKPGKLEGDLSVAAMELDGLDSSLKMPNIKKPSIDIPIPTVEGKIDVDTALSKPEVEVAASGLSVDIKGPAADFHAPTTDMDVGSADQKLKGAGGKFKMPTVKMPSFGISLPKFKGPDVDVSMKKPDVDISLVEPELDIKGLTIDVGVPECEVDVKVPDTGEGSKIKMPKMEGPKFGFSGSDMKFPNLDVDISLTKAPSYLTEGNVGVKVTEVKTKPGKLVGDLNVGDIELQGPDANVKMSNIQKPLTLEAGVDVDASQSKPEFDVKVPDLSVDFRSPERVIHASRLNMGADSVDTKEGDADPNLKMPEVEVSSFGVSLSKFMFPDVDFGMKTTDKDISLSQDPDVAKAVTKEPGDSVQGKTEEDPNKTVPELKGQKDAELTTTDDSSTSKGKTSWFKFPKISFSSPWRKEKDTDVEKKAAHEITTLSTGPVKFSVKTTDVKTDGHDNLSKGSTDEVTPLIFPISKEAVVEGAENTAADDNTTQVVTVKCKNPDVTTAGTYVKTPSQVVTSTARTELALLESGDFTMNVQSSKTSKMSLPECSRQDQVPSCEISSGHLQNTLIETKITKTNEEQQSIDKSGIFQIPNLSISSLPEGSLRTYPTEHSTVVTKEYLIHEQAASGTPEPVKSTKECSSFLSEFHLPKSEYTVSAEGHAFTKKYTKTEGTVVVLTESSVVQGDIVPEATTTDDTSTVFQRMREMIQSEQKQFDETSQHSSVSISVTESETKQVKKTVTK